MRASGGPAVVVPISDAVLLVPPLSSPRRPDRQPAAACHNLLDELPKQDTSSEAAAMAMGQRQGGGDDHSRGSLGTCPLSRGQLLASRRATLLLVDPEQVSTSQP